jgi:hypothetical protein
VPQSSIVMMGAVEVKLSDASVQDSFILNSLLHMLPSSNMMANLVVIPWTLQHLILVCTSLLYKNFKILVQKFQNFCTMF